MRFLRLLNLAILVWIAASPAPADEPAAPDARAILERCESLELYSVAPGIHGAFGRGYQSAAGPLPDALDALDELEGVYGSVVVADATSRALVIRGLVTGLAGPGIPADCYAPRHALVATLGGRRAVFHLCFECGRATVLDASTAVGQYVGFGPAPELKRTLDGLLDAAKVPLAEHQGDKPLARPAVVREGAKLDPVVAPGLRAFFDGADSLELFAIDENVYATWGYGGATDPSPLTTALAALDAAKGVFGRTPIRRAATRKDILERVWDGAGNTDMVAKCYLPRHALVATKGTERAILFLCFECHYISPIAHDTAKGKLFPYGDVGELRVMFEQLLARRGIKR